MASAAHREASIPRFALRRSEAAASLGISPTLFDEWVHDGLMPEGRKIRGVVLWDTNEIRECWQELGSGPINSV
jgi:predicted DNA-binding transcriptional regulator AlpA